MLIPKTVVSRLLVTLLVVTGLALVTSRMVQAAPPTSAQATGAIIYAVQSDNTLIAFESANPGNVLRSVAISGLQGGENIVGIDYRPASTELYAVSSQSRMYTINPVSGAATMVGSGPFTPALNGTSFGWDFNPTVDRIRLTSNSDQNLRLHPVTGAVVFTDGTLAYAAGDPNQGANPNVVASAYTNSFYGATTTTLYNLDSNLDALITQTPPNSGTLNTVGALGVNITDNAGFDISPEGGAFAALDTGSGASLYSIDLSSGAASVVGGIGAGNLTIVGIAVAPPPFTVYAVDNANNLHAFYSSDSANIISTMAISGLQTDEDVLGIDIRPATGELYALGSTSRLYKINPDTAVATVVGSGPFTPSLNGTAFGFDFNPTVDRIRITSDNEQNLRAHPDTGAVVFTDGTLTYAAGDPNAGANPNVVGSGYTNNFVGFGSTTLYNIDSDLDILVGQVPPNDGTLNTVGALGINVGDEVGFDIPSGLGLNQYAFASANVGGTYGLYSINLTTGGAVPVGNIGNGTTPIVDIAVDAPPVNAYLLGTNGTTIYGINTANPAYLLGQFNISTGLQVSETLVAMDVRPANGGFFALGSTNRLYSLNLATGTATQVGSAPLTTTVTGPGIGFDFNPTVDRLRINSSTDQNLRVNPDTGVLIQDGTLAFGVGDPNEAQNPNVVAAAYTNNFSGTATTMLYNLDSGLDILVTQNPANAGTLQTVGALGVAIDETTGFDIDDSTTQVALATVTEVSPELGFSWDGRDPSGATSAIYSIDLTTGRATFVSILGAPVLDIALNLERLNPTAVSVASIATAPASNPYLAPVVGALVLGGLLGIILLRRRR
jgi:trimeric autotransporter adhesin